KSPVLIDAIRALAEGGTYLDPAVSGFVFTGATGDAGVPTDILTKRELEVLRLIADGISLSDIGDKLHLSPKTVSTHKMRLKQKLGIENNADLIRYAVKHNIKG
ncbi:MAG: DNA-binding response regulator, partial [Rhodocyclaceae bacterium]